MKNLVKVVDCERRSGNSCRRNLGIRGVKECVEHLLCACVELCAVLRDCAQSACELCDIALELFYAVIKRIGAVGELTCSVFEVACAAVNLAESAVELNRAAFELCRAVFEVVCAVCKLLCAVVKAVNS